MLFLLGLLLAFIPTLIGWGSATLWVAGRLGRPSPYAYDPLEPIVGLIVLTTIANVANFFAPITHALALWIVIIGWVLFLRRLTTLLKLVKPFWLGVGLVWLAVISTQAVLQPWHYDSGLYHIPAIRWLVDYKLPLGLANLHHRFGLNSAWFSVSALMAQSVAPFTANYTAIASETLFAVFGLAVLCALYRFLNHDRSLPTFFLLLSGLIGFTPLVSEALSSPSTDHPVLLVTLLLIYVTLRGVMSREPDPYDTLMAFAVTFYAITLKVSAAPLVLFPLAMFALSYRRRWKRGLRELAPLTLVASALILGPWIVRGVFLSGCLLFPVSSTCFATLPWTVPRGIAESLSSWIASWARRPGLTPDQVLGNWNWFKPWVVQLVDSKDFILPMASLGVGLVLMAIAWRQVRMFEYGRRLLLLLAIVGIGTGFWFVTAPDFRFGASWVWAAALMCLALAFWAMVQRPRLRIPIALAAMVMLLGSAKNVANVGLGYMHRAGWTYSDILYSVPPMPSAQVVEQNTKDGVPIKVVQDSRCFWVAPYCTPYFQADLVVIKPAGGRLEFHAGR